MQKRTFLLLIMVLSLAIISTLLAYNPTRGGTIAAFVALGTMILTGANSIITSAWFQRYGIGVVGILSLMTGVTLTALYYRGKLRIWRYGATKASEITAARQPAPAPTPTPLATPPPTQTVKVTEEKSEAET